MDFRLYILNILRGRNVLSKIILANIAVFVVLNLFLLMVSASPMNTWIGAKTLALLGVPSSFGDFIYQPWSIVTFMFTNVDLLTTLFGLLYLFFLGNIFQDFVGSRKLMAVYMWGGVLSALVFLGASELFPTQGAMSLTGFSVCILAVLTATATLVPDYELSLLLLGRIRLKWIALIFLALDVISVTRFPLPVILSHITAIVFGFGYVYNLKHHTFVGEGVQTITTFVKRIRIFKPRRKKSFQSKASVYSTAGFDYEDEEPSQEDIDAILDKISQSGYKSLSEKEKHILFKASKQN